MRAHPSSVLGRLTLGVSAICVLCGCRPQAPRTPEGPAGTTALEFGTDSTPQPATADDIHIFDPYIGRFQSMRWHDPDLDKDLHYLVEYRWFDSTRSVVRFKVSTEYLDGSQGVSNAAGFYGYDPFNGRLYTFGVFSSGVTGFGAVGAFDRTTGSRVTWARSKGPDGVTTWVRDAFRMMNPDTWTDETSIRREGSEAWQVVYRDTFTRMGP
ncbi:MAG: hypothetical protein AB7I33_00675 [Gemmatimonadales bacterium]